MRGSFSSNMSWICQYILENIVVDEDDKIFITEPNTSLGFPAGYLLRGFVELGILEKIVGERIVSIKERIGSYLTKPKSNSSGFIVKEEGKIRIWSTEFPFKSLEEWILFYGCKKTKS